MTSSHENSDREFITLLIELYRDCPVLWNVKNKNYFNRNKKSAALENIVGVLRKLKPDFSVKQLKQKINVLRTNFNREFKAIESRKVSKDDIPESTLWYFNDMYFIKDQHEIAQNDISKHPIPNEDSQSKLNLKIKSRSDVITTPTAKTIAKNKKMKYSPETTDQLVTSETEEDILAKVWAIKLKKLAPDQRRFAEKIINDTLFEAEMGALTWEGTRCETFTHWSPPS